MMRDGPIPFFLHGVLEYVAAAAFVVAPFLLDFESGTATALSIIFGVVILVIAAATDGPTSLVDQIPRQVHVLLDYALAVLLIAMPFLAGFSDETAPTVLFLAGGIVYLLVSIGSRYRTRGELRPGSDAATGDDRPGAASRRAVSRSDSR